MTKDISKLLVAFLLVLMLAPVVHAQEMQQQEEEPVQTYTAPRWVFGLGGGVNFNFYEGTIRNLSESSFHNGPFIAPAAFDDGGFGIKPYAAGIIEYRFNDMWGLNMNFGYDARGGLWDEITEPWPCNCEADLETTLSYFVFEPSLRFAPFRGGFHLFAGPRLAYVFEKDFTYQRDQQFLPDKWVHEAEFSDMKDLIISMQVGAGYDIMLSKPERQTKWMLTPFVSFHPYFGQAPRDIDTWGITTVRAGLALKVGRGVPVPLPEPPVEPEPIVEPEPEIVEPPVAFSVRPPVLERRRITNEVFPLRNYIFFEDGATTLPGRYILLSRAEAQQFSEAGLKDRVMINTRGRGYSQMQVYYNILNILGDRMRNNPNTSITLVGSSAGKGIAIGAQQAEAIKDYLVSVFDIAPQRITTRGADWPEVRSYRHAQQTDVELRLDSDRRVDILSSDKELLMTDVRRLSPMLKPVMFSRSDESELDSHIIFTLTNAERYMEEWHVTLTDPSGQVLELGPFTKNMESVPGQEIFDVAEPGLFTVVMKGVSKEGLEFSRETTMELVPKEVKDHHVIRFSMLYEFDISETPAPYKEYLVEAVVPLVPENARVIVHGHTDVIGDVEHNYHLSLQRARSAKQLIEDALASYGIDGVEFEVYGFGEMKDHAPFENRYPEERFYNRTVIIDIIPR